MLGLAQKNKNDMGRPRIHAHLPDYMYPDGDRGGFIVRNPITGKRKRFSASQEAEARKAAELLARAVDKIRTLTVLDAGRPTVRSVIAEWRREREPHMPWDTRTRQERAWKVDRIERELGDRAIAQVDCLALENWLLSFYESADQFNKWRYMLVLLWRFAVSRKYATVCEPERIEVRSISKKLAANRKRRQQLDVDGFREIHAAAPPWLQLAMEQSLITLLARNEICAIEHAHYRNGFLFVIRDKTAGDSEMAFIKIALTPELEDIRARSRKLDDTVSPLLIHRKPEKRTRAIMARRPHWTYVDPPYLSKAFAAARDGIERFAKMEPGTRPTFHEIRGLGSRLLRAAGVAEDAIQALMTHSTPKTTRIYLERGPEALTDADYNPVTAPLSARELLK